jgi:hypothetical protein
MQTEDDGSMASNKPVKKYVTDFKDKDTNKPAKQSFKPICDINTIIDKAKRTGVLSHVTANAGFYADMTDFDYDAARDQIAQTNSVFYELDAEIRREFGNDPGAFLKFVGNKTPEQIVEAIPALAEKGTQLPDVVAGSTNPVLNAEPPADPAPPVEPSGGTEVTPTE